MMAFIAELNREKMMLNDFEDVNRILDELAEQGILEPVVEPIDEETCHPLDWADVVGVDIFDELYHEPLYLLDDNGKEWQVI
jgi:hypothetical protein